MTQYFKHQKVVVQLLQEIGSVETPDTTEVTVISKDSSGNVTQAKGATLPSTESGYALECEFVDTDKAAGTPKLYRNVGTTSSATWDLVGIGEAIVTSALMGTVAAFGFPFNVTVDTEQVAALAKADDGGSFANLAVTAAEGGYTANYQIWPDTELEDDACYFGAAAPFGVLTFNVAATVATYGADSVEWEYYNGTTWATLTIIYDETDTNDQSGARPFMQDGQLIFSAPTDWASTTIDSQAAYWIRARIKAGFNVTQIPLLDSEEHKLVTSPTALEMPTEGVIGRGRISFVTVSGANNDTKIILCNLTKGTASAITTLTQALAANEVADFAVACDAGDQIVVYITQEDGTTEFANGIMELLLADD